MEKQEKNIQIPKQLQNPEYRFLRLSNQSKAPIPKVLWKSTPLEFNNIHLLNHFTSNYRK